MFDVGSLESRLELDRTPFLTGLRAARMEGQRFERESFTATVDVNLDAANAERRLEEFEHGDHTLHSDFDLDTGAAMAKIELLKREAAGIGGGIGGGVGGVPGGGGGASSGGILGTGGFIRPSALLAGGVGAASFLPTVGASAAQGALGAGALGLGLGGAAAVGLAATVATAVPAITALKAAETAQLNYNKAVATYGKDSTEAKTALKSVKAAQDALVPSAQRVMDSIEGLKSRWGELSQPAQRQFFGILNDGIKEANHLMPMFADIAQQDIGAARDAIDHLLASMNTGDFSAFVHTMSNLFAQGIGPVERGVENILHVLGRIAVAVAPDVLRMLQGFARTTHQWEQDTRNAADLQRHVHGTVREFGAWFDVATSLGHLLAALFLTNQQGAKTGRQEVEALSHQLDAWSRWVEHHHGDINHFFGQLNQTFGLLVSSAGEIAKVVLPAFKPVADVIHEVVQDLNSIKVGNVSALTVLLAIMAGRGIAGKLGLAAAGTTAAEGAGGAGLLARLGGGSSAVGAGAVAAAGTEVLGVKGTVQDIAGGGVGHAIGDIGLHTILGPGSFAARGLRELPLLGGAIGGVEDHVSSLAHKVPVLGGAFDDVFGSGGDAPLHQARERLHSLERQLAASGNAFKDFGGNVRETLDDARRQLKATDLGTRMADAVGEGKGKVKDILKDYEQRFEALPPSLQDSAIKSAKTELDALQQMGGITKKEERQTLNDLEDMQAQSQRKQRQKWDQFGRVTNRLVGGWFGSMANTVDTILGNKGITGMVNQLLSGVSSQDKLKWNATTVGHIAGTLSGFLSGGQRGGFTGGFSSFDDRMIPVRGNEAILRGEDHVPIVSAALQNTYGMTLGDLFNRSGAARNVGGGRAGGGMAGGGMTFPLKGNYSWGRIDMGVDFGGTADILAMGDATVTQVGAPGWPGGGGVVYRLMNPSGRLLSPYIYNFENVTASVRPGQRVHTGEKVGHLNAGYPGLEIGFATSSGAALAAPHYSEGDDTHEGHSMYSLLKALSHGASISGGIGSIPRIVVHGPKGAGLNALQGTANLGRREANRFLSSISTPVGLSHGTARSAGINSAREFIPFWDKVNPGEKEFAHAFSLIVPRESGWNPRASNGTHFGWYQFDSPTWSDFKPKGAPGAPEGPYDPLLATQAAGNVAAREGWGGVSNRWAATYQGHQFGGWLANGFDGIVNGPVTFGAGEKGRERVRVEPISANRPSPDLSGMKIIVKGDIVSDYADPVVAVLGSREFPIAVQREISGDRAHSRQLRRMRR